MAGADASPKGSRMYIGRAPCGYLWSDTYGIRLQQHLLVCTGQVQFGECLAPCYYCRQVFRSRKWELVKFQFWINSHLVIAAQSDATISLGYRHHRSRLVTIPHRFNDTLFLSLSNSSLMAPLRAYGTEHGWKNLGLAPGFTIKLACISLRVPILPETTAGVFDSKWSAG